MMRKLCLLVSTIFYAACTPKYQTLTPDEFEQMTAQPEVMIVDVRTPEEYVAGHIANALNLDWRSEKFAEQAIEQLDKTTPIALYCKAGRRSHAAAGKLHQMGFTQIVELQGGFDAWQAAGKTTETDNCSGIDTYEVDVFRTPNGKTVKIHALVHASLWIEAGDIQIMVDPVTQLNDRTIDYAAMPKADFILITHEHHDHFDKDAIRTLSDEKTQMIMNKACAEQYGKGITLVNGDQRQLTDDISIEAVPAYNTTKDHLHFHPKGRDNGYILTIDGMRIYIAGDTEDIPEMEAFKDIDIAFLPCNQPYTMTHEQLIKTAKIIHPQVLFPYHYGQTNVSTIPTALADEKIDVRIRHYE